MRALLLLPLLFLSACDSGVNPAVLDLSGVYESRFGTSGNVYVGTATWDIRGTDVTLDVVIVDGAGYVESHTLRGSYFQATNDMRLTGSLRGRPRPAPC